MSAKVLSSGSSPLLASITKRTMSASPMAISVCARMRPCRRLGRRILETGRVDHVEVEIVEPGRVDAAVAGDARRVVDQRQLAPDKAVEKRRLADVRPADDGCGEAHRRITTRRRNRGSVRTSRWRAGDIARRASSAAIWSNSAIAPWPCRPSRPKGRAPRGPNGAACWCRWSIARAREDTSA